MSLRIGSLFSGIGGLELGLEWAGLGHTVWQVEQNPYCRDVLTRHWPEAERHNDVREVGKRNLAAVDIICGGFPCQDVSSAGKRAGLGGTRSGLWYEFARILDECYPAWVVVENVRSGAAKWVDAVRGDLERIGYATLPIPLSAADVGAPHRRDRVFVVGALAHANSDGIRDEHGRASRTNGESTAQPARHSGWAAEPGVARVVHGLSGRVDREKALGNSVVPQCAEVVGHVIKQLMERR